MDLKCFWDLIEHSLKAVAEGRDQPEDLEAELSRLPAEDILAFNLRYEALMRAAYRHDVWVAVTLIEDGCWDGAFHDFRCWLVAQGKRVYENALANPDSLADVLPRDEPCEGRLDGAAIGAWSAATGRPLDDYFEVFLPLRPDWGQPDMGEMWNGDDPKELRRRLPRLARIYIDDVEHD